MILKTFVNWRIRLLMSRTGYTFGIYFTQSSHITGCQKLGIVLENKVLMYFQNRSYQKISRSENDKRCVLIYLANFRSWTVLSTLASSTSILIGDCLFPLHAGKNVDKKFKYLSIHNGSWNGILLPKLFRPTSCEKKIVVVIEKNF